jgi:hypothetical protein
MGRKRRSWNTSPLEVQWLHRLGVRLTLKAAFLVSVTLEILEAGSLSRSRNGSSKVAATGGIAGL